MKRNPRRAYDKDGQELQPATVASHMALGRQKSRFFATPAGIIEAGLTSVSSLQTHRSRTYA